MDSSDNLLLHVLEMEIYTKSISYIFNRTKVGNVLKPPDGCQVLPRTTQELDVDQPVTAEWGTDKLTIQPQKYSTITVILDHSTFPRRKGAHPK